MTPEEQLDEARAKEALHRLVNSGQVYCHEDIAALGARLARENWTPPEPVDPDLAAFLKWHASHPLASFQEAYIAGVWMARKQEQERAKVLVELVEDLTTLSSDDSISPIPGVASFTLAKYRGEA